MRGDAHGGFGERSGETGQEQSQYRAPGLLSNTFSCDEWRSHYKRRWPAGFAAAALRPARRPENTQSARDSPLT